MDDANDAELEGLQLRVYYDGNSTAAIDVDVGHFFGAGKFLKVLHHLVWETKQL